MKKKLFKIGDVVIFIVENQRKLVGIISKMNSNNTATIMNHGIPIQHSLRKMKLMTSEEEMLYKLENAK